MGEEDQTTVEIGAGFAKPSQKVQRQRSLFVGDLNPERRAGALSSREHTSDKREVGCSNRSPWIIWRQALGPANCPYIVRWVFDAGWFSLRLHHWLRSDDLRHLHDHGFSFLSLVLRGSVIDRTEAGDRVRGWLSVSRFPATHRHAVVVPKPAWTLLLAGREWRTWGYWVNGKFRKRNKYFFEHGHHDPCGQSR